jgi:hypothetical protein
VSAPTPRHWHITRDIKPKGECAGCDEYWEAEDEDARKDVLNPHLKPEHAKLLTDLQAEGKL